MLDSALRIAPQDAELLNDLAVMNFELATREQRLEPMLEALDLVERSVAADTTFLPALFNRALILERLYLVEGARRAWQQYLAEEHDARWRREAEQHARWLEPRRDSVPWSQFITMTVGADSGLAREALSARVAWSPQSAREFCFTTLLGEWGVAVLDDDRSQAAELLSVARAIAAAFEELGLDYGIPLALGTIDRLSADHAQLRRLAAAHREFATGLNFFLADAFNDALPTLERATQSLGSLGSPAARWAGLYLAGARLSTGDYVGADRGYGDVLAEATQVEPALIGKANAALGVSQLRLGNYERAHRQYQTAAPHFARAKEQENEGYVFYLVTEVLNFTGQSAAGHDEAYRGLRFLSPFRGSNYLNNHLTTVAGYARAAGLTHAALRVRDEVLHVAEKLGKPSVIAWALRARARDLIALDRPGAASDDLDAALAIIEKIPAGHVRDRVVADVNLVLGQLASYDDPAASLRTLSDVAAAYRRLNLLRHVPIALYQSALAAQRAGDRDLARDYLQETILHIERQQATFVAAELRASLSETVEDVFDAMIRMELDDARPLVALEYLERARIAGWAPGAHAVAEVSSVDVSADLKRLISAIPADALLVDYAVLPERLAIWTLSRAGLRSRVITLPRDSLAGLTMRFTSELASMLTEPPVTASWLHDLLLAPLAGELAEVRQLIVVPDRELNTIPFAALWNRQSQRYVVEEYEVRVLPSITFLFAALARPLRSPDVNRAVVVGNPKASFDAAEHLPTLPGAAREARAIAPLYDDVTLLLAGDATRHEVLESLPYARVFHFAGHAVFNTQRPEMSYLAFASDGSDDGLLRARAIGDLRLPNLQVVVLSACSTLNPRPSRTGAVAGIAYSFLRAGAPATISTLWDVADDIAEPLLVRFHRELTSGVPGAEALRAAQLASLRAPDPASRAPGRWAAFTFTGF